MVQLLCCPRTSPTQSHGFPSVCWGSLGTFQLPSQAQVCVSRDLSASAEAEHRPHCRALSWPQLLAQRAGAAADPGAQRAGHGGAALAAPGAQPAGHQPFTSAQMEVPAQPAMGEGHPAHFRSYQLLLCPVCETNVNVTSGELSNLQHLIWGTMIRLRIKLDPGQSN